MSRQDLEYLRGFNFTTLACWRPFAELTISKVPVGKTVRSAKEAATLNQAKFDEIIGIKFK